MNFDTLLSNNVMMEGCYASDPGSCARRLERTEEVKALSPQMTEDAAKELCLCLTKWMNRAYDRRYRHPMEMAFCAGLVLLKDHLKLAEVQGLFESIYNISEPALCWVVMVAEYLKSR